jgi:penicillin-binding protein 1A
MLGKNSQNKQNEKQKKKLDLKNEKNEKLNEEVENQKVKIKNKKFSWKKLLLNIVLFPFRLIEFIFKFFYSILNVLLLILAVGVFAGVIIFAKVYPMYQEASTTAYDKLAHLQDSDFRMLENTRIYDKDGNILGEIDAGDYQYVDITDVSDYIQNGYIATEDKRFMQHIGIDAQSLIRAAISLFKHNGEVTQGGSTITQQVIKNNILSQEQTYSRKLVEVLIAPKLEQRYSKDKIMEFYVNTCYYGNGCYGVETASQYYFGKSAKDISLAEAAMLCGVSNSPNNYNPVASMELATQKKEQVLKNMLDEGYITEKEYNSALKKKIKIKASLDEYDNDNYMISYALYCTALQLMEQDGFEFKYYFSSYDEQKKYNKAYQKAYTAKSSLIRAGGYSIYTSFNQKLQKKLQKAVNKQLSKYTEKQDNGKFALQGSAVCVDNTTGYVVAMVGGRTSKDEYNRAFLAKRQPGSSIKPLLVYAPAINEGVVVPSTIYTDKKVYAVAGDTSSYSPTNSGGGYRGNMTVREALARSINTIAYQIYRDTGSKESMQYLANMKFSTLTYADTTAQSLCLGGFTDGVRVVDLAKGYATLPMGGQYSDRTCIKKIEHETEGLVFESKDLASTEKEVFNSDTAYMMCDMMQGTLEEDYGTGKSIRNKDMIAGGKTGTTSSSKDVWFSGFTKYYTCSVWVGYDTPRAMYGQYGGGMPAQIWSNFMTSISKNMTKADFDKPDTISLRKSSNGSYSGKDIKLKYKEGKSRYYTLRKGGTDWYSKLNEITIKLAEQNRIAKEAYKKANNAVKAFENFYIQSIDDALGLDDKYASIVDYIDKVDDEYKAGNLRKRASKHYDLLTDTVMEEWQTYIDEYYDSEKTLATAKQEEALEDSKISAQNQLKQNRINKAEWYITELNNRNYNTSVTQLLYKDAKKAVKRLKGYDEYSSYKSRLASAKTRIDGLPTDLTAPEIPQDYEDDTSIDESEYEDKEVEDYEEALDEYNKWQESATATPKSKKNNTKNKVKATASPSPSPSPKKKSYQ